MEFHTYYGVIKLTANELDEYNSIIDSNLDVESYKIFKATLLFLNEGFSVKMALKYVKIALSFNKIMNEI